MRALLIALVLVVCSFSNMLGAEAQELPVTSPFGWRIHPQTGDWRFC